jgi:hypothetical protein
MSRSVMLPAYSEMIMSKPPRQRDPLGTNVDDNVPSRSRGIECATSSSWETPNRSHECCVRWRTRGGRASAYGTDTIVTG